MSAEGPKLCGSCHVCTVSKVRCSKEKPICSRCSKRGTVCEYPIAKRRGRKLLEHRSTTKTSNNTTQTRLATVPQELPERDRVPMAVPLADHQRLSPPGMTPSSLDISSLFESAEDSSSLPLTDWDTGVDEYLVCLNMPQTANLESLGAESGIASPQSTSSGSSARPPGDSVMPAVPPCESISLFGRSALLGSRESSGPHFQHADKAVEYHQPLSCACLSRALDQLKGLTTNNLWDGKTTGPPPGDSPGERRSIDTITQANKQMIDQMHTILHCRCSENSYLQAVMALDRCTTATDSRLSAAQRVLSELHHVQRVVNQLSQRSTASPASTGPLPDMSISSAVSDIVMDYLVQELRKQLETLSSGISKMLQWA